MELTTTIGIGLLLIVVAAIYLWSPWNQPKLDLTSREEIDDLVKGVPHVDPVVKEQVETAIKNKRQYHRKKVRSACELEGIETATPAVKRRTNKKVVQ